MRPDETTEPITIQAAKELVNGLDALAAATHRSRNEVVDQALRQYLDSSTWQIARIEEGIAAAREGRVRPAEDALADLASRHGFER